MATLSKSRLKLAIAVPALIFLACALIRFSTKYKTQQDQLSLAIILDLLITAPLAYYLLIRKTVISKITVLRVFMAGIVVAGLLISKNDSQILSIIKLWISPAIEMSLVGFIIWKFYTAKKNLASNNLSSIDFLVHCRAILKSVFGNEKAAAIMASEVAVFYYTFCKKEKHIQHSMRFTSYKENGIILILGTFLCLFIIETVGMHFVFQLWSNTAAWILTILSFYTCIQLFSHIRSLKIRSTLLLENDLLIRNGILGGDTMIHLDNIESVLKINKPVLGTDVVKIGLFNGLEKNNIAIYLKEPVTVIKAFGIKKTAKIILISIDKCEGFIAALNTSYIEQSS
ncbi:MAG: hypothetical protein ABI402_13935 [Ferruginibacter sp.]